MLCVIIAVGEQCNGASALGEGYKKDTFEYKISFQAWCEPESFFLSSVVRVSVTMLFELQNISVMLLLKEKFREQMLF